MTESSWPEQPHARRVRENYQRSEVATKRFAKVDEQTVDEWLEGLGTQFLNVTFFNTAGEQSVERHVNDCTTLPETVRMTMERKLSLVYAVYPYMGRWCLVTPGKAPTKLLRYYDTQEAAEMVAILRG